MPNIVDTKKSRRKKLAENLRELRVESGYTQNNLARILGINRSTYSYYELGKTLPDIPTLSVLCKLYNITIIALLDMDSQKVHTRQRAPRRVDAFPEIIGQLTSSEKEFIALMRLYPEIMEEWKASLFQEEKKNPDKQKQHGE